jgi:uncharacterized protein
VIVIGDTSGLVAAFNNDDSEHSVARRAFREASATVISPLVFAEIEHILKDGVCGPDSLDQYDDHHRCHRA